ncbi:glycogen debranching protein GlgX [Vibrio sp. WXL103]|uniref:glycogen debranching protein GlgX n=1 Tax=Vibrio sp. WXL103 TaxID=3450710 RepID=UPI003EC6B1D5
MNNKRTKPITLGAALDGSGCQFAIHAPNQPFLKLALFSDGNNYQTFPLESDCRGIQSVYIEGVKAGQRYGYIGRVEGKPHFISDPYAKALDGPVLYPRPFDSTNSFSLPKCIVINDDFDWQGTDHPYIPREETILFETHTKGVSKLNPLVAADEQGTYLGLINEDMLAFYRAQNINTIQLLPIAACLDEPHLEPLQKVNYWGYNPYVFMAPDPRFAREDAVTELKTAVRELHRNGIEVILDVVYNHTAEGGDGGCVLNLKALDPRYYLMHNGHFTNYTGCGNTVDMDYQPSLNLVMDTLRYWVTEYKIDGFRFDLAATLGRNGDQFNPNAAFFRAVAQDPVLSKIKLIAEPWDIGPNGYQVGQFPLGWNECNDKLRDITRSFWRGDHGYLKEFATRLMGSRDLYSASTWPYNLTVNYITYHDGFTMQDLVSYKHKHNEANGEHNRDGHGDNRSENYGIEGPTDNHTINELREKQKRNFMTSLLFSFGIPHILTADVLSHSQQGNNNAYCQDNPISWLDWRLDERKKAFKDWLAEMIAARQKYMVPFIQAFSGHNRNQNRVYWRRVNGGEMSHDDWNQLRSVSMHMGIGQDGDELFYCINQTNAPARFALPKDRKQEWQMICNTDSHELHRSVDQSQVLVEPCSIAIFHYKAK